MKWSMQINKQQYIVYYTYAPAKKKATTSNQTSSLLQKQTLAHEHLTN